MNSYEQYAVLKRKVDSMKKENEEQIEAFKEESDFENVEAQALEAMLASRNKRETTIHGTITVIERKTYEYPQEWEETVIEHKESKKRLEKELRSAGKYSIEPSLRLYDTEKLQVISKKKGAIHA